MARRALALLARPVEPAAEAAVSAAEPPAVRMTPVAEPAVDLAWGEPSARPERRQREPRRKSACRSPTSSACAIGAPDVPARPSSGVWAASCPRKASANHSACSELSWARYALAWRRAEVARWRDEESRMLTWVNQRMTLNRLTVS